MTGHGGEKADSAVDICAVVLERYFARLAHGLQLVNACPESSVSEDAEQLYDRSVRCHLSLKAYLQSSKMNHAVDIRVCLEDLVEVLLFSDVNMKKVGSLAADELNAIDCLF